MLVRRSQEAPGLWRLCFALPWPVNCYLDRQAEGLTLIDTGYPWSAQSVVAAVASMGVPLRRVVLTHAHPDHAGSLRAVVEAKRVEIVAHPAAVDILEGRATLADAPAWWLARWVHRLLHRFGQLDPSPVSGVTAVQDGDRIGPWRVLHTPGHTPGSLSLWDEDRSVLILGDNLVNQPWGQGPGVPWFTLDLEARRRSLERLKDVPARRLLPGHGKGWNR